MQKSGIQAQRLGKTRTDCPCQRQCKIVKLFKENHHLCGVSNQSLQCLFMTCLVGLR